MCLCVPIQCNIMFACRLHVQRESVLFSLLQIFYYLTMEHLLYSVKTSCTCMYSLHNRSCNYIHTYIHMVI